MRAIWPSRSIGRRLDSPRGMNSFPVRTAVLSEPRPNCPALPRSGSTSSTCRRFIRSDTRIARARTLARLRTGRRRQSVGDRQRTWRPHGDRARARHARRFRSLRMQTARALGIEIALDYALQCSPDHPWVTEHPEWFHVRLDGTIKFAENPPKKYQDIYPLNFWCDGLAAGYGTRAATCCCSGSSTA